MPKQQTKGSFFIEVLKWAARRETFTKTEICEGLNPSKDPVRNTLISRYFDDMFCGVGGEDERYHISYDAYFNLLEHDELQDARNSAKSAKWTAIIAILLSLAGFVASIILGYKQINNPIKIRDEQLDDFLQRQAIIEQKQINSIIGRPLKLDDEQLELLTSRPIKLDPEQLKIIKGWIDEWKQRRTKNTSQRKSN